MGRHSAGDDDEGTDVRLAAPVVDAPGRPGRHSRTEDSKDTPDTADTEDTGPVDPDAVRTAGPPTIAQDEQPTERIGLADLLAAAEEDAEPAPRPAVAEAPVAPPVPKPEGKDKTKSKPKAPEAPRPPRGSQSTAADLELLRKHPDVRARVIAAVVVPFVLYAAVLLLIGATAVQYLIFIWVPMVTAGVLAGLFLDAAHKRARAAPPDDSGG